VLDRVSRVDFMKETLEVDVIVSFDFIVAMFFLHELIAWYDLQAH